MHSPLLTTIFSVFGSPTSPHSPPSPTTQRKAIRWSEFIQHPKEYNMRSGDIFLDFDGVVDHIPNKRGEAEEENGRVHRVYLDTDGEWVEVTEEDWDSADWDDDATDWSELEPEPKPKPKPTAAAVVAAVPAVAPVAEVSSPPQLKRKRTEDDKTKGRRQWMKRRNTDNEDGDGYETGLQVDMRMSLTLDEEEELGISGMRVSRYVWRPEEMRREVDVWRTRLWDDE